MRENTVSEITALEANFQKVLGIACKTSLTLFLNCRYAPSLINFVLFVLDRNFDGHVYKVHWTARYSEPAQRSA